MSNPWGLTPGQAKAMDALIEAGCAKRACDLIGITEKTLECHVGEARRKMGLRHRTHYTHILMWDRWKRSAS